MAMRMGVIVEVVVVIMVVPVGRGRPRGSWDVTVVGHGRGAVPGGDTS